MVVMILFSSCMEREGPEVVQVNNQYELWVPKNLFKTKELNEDASLQYMNAFDELYVIVIDENLREVNEAFAGLYDSVETLAGFEIYVNLVSSSFFNALSLDTYPEFNNTTIHGMPARVARINAMSDGERVAYEYALVKGEDCYYQIITWTLADQREKMQQKMDKMIVSFKEIHSDS